MRSFCKGLLFVGLVFLFALASGLAEGKTYYVDATNGNDSNSGLSHSTAWKTLNKVNYFKSFNSGDDVYLLCGKTWTGQTLSVHWSGSSSNPVIIGAYYVAGSEKIGVNGAGKPKIDGKNTFPTSEFGALVSVDSKYVIIQDLDFRHSNQYGVKFANSSNNCTVRRCKVDDTYRENIYFAGGANNGKVEYCELSRGSRMRLDMIGECRGWPPGGIRMAGTNYGIVQNNWIYNQYAEGINLGHYSKVMYNLIGDTQSVGIYIQSQHGAEIAYNLVYGTDTKTYNSISSCSDVQTDWKGNGIAAGIEFGANYGDLYDVKIHHNIVVNRLSGIRVYNTHTTAKLLSLDIYNNTLIDNRFSFNISNNDDKVDGKVNLRNNISYPKHRDANHLNFAGASLHNWVIDHNTWAIDNAPTGIWSGAGDVNIDPRFSKANWKGSINGTSDFAAAKMMPTASALGNGVKIGSYYNKFIDPNSDYSTLNPDLITGDPITVVLSLKSASTPWPMGAIKMTTGSSSGSVQPPKLFITD